jgi:hypothetical protein
MEVNGSQNNRQNRVSVNLTVSKGYNLFNRSQLSLNNYNKSRFLGKYIPFILHNPSIVLIHNVTNRLEYDMLCIVTNQSHPTSNFDLDCSQSKNSTWIVHARVRYEKQTISHPIIRLDMNLKVDRCARFDIIEDERWPDNPVNESFLVSNTEVTCTLLNNGSIVYENRSNVYFNSTSVNKPSKILAFLANGNDDVIGLILNCSNRGFNVFNSELGKYQCSCNRSFIGSWCEKDLRLCALNPCLNAGKCEDLFENNGKLIGKGYKCECPSMYEGSQCETRIDLCKNETCSGNGNCLIQNETTICECYLGYTGEKCDTESQSMQLIKGVVRFTSVIAIIILSLFYLLILAMDIHKLYLSLGKTKQAKSLNKSRPKPKPLVYIE